MAVPANPPRGDGRVLAVRVLSACAAASFAPWASAQPHSTTELFVAADVTGFHYEEFVEGEVFNREKGVLPGLRISLRGDDDPVFTRIDASFHTGEVDYWSPANGDSTTGTQFLTGSIEAGGWLDSQRQWGGFLRLARRVWGRDIHGTDNASGLYEEYRWSEVGIGAVRRWSGPHHNWTHSFSATAYAVTGGSMFVELSGVSGANWDDETLDLGDSSGLRVRYTATHDRGSYSVLIEPYYEYWEFGRSNEKPITSDGTPTGLVVHEPRSESQRAGVALGMGF